MKKTLFLIAGIALGALALAIPAHASALDLQTGLPLIAFGGMIVNRENIGIIFTNIKTIFNKAFTATETTWQMIAMEVPSTGAANSYKWLSRFPKMREWIGEKNVKALEASDYTVKNRDFEATVEVDRNDIDDDNLGIYSIDATAAGQSAAELPEDIIYEVVNAAFSKPCYDGQNFFDTDHPVTKKDGTVISVSNMTNKKFDISTLAKAQASYGAARIAMRKFKDNEGESLKIRPNILLVSPALEDEANLLMTADRLEDGKPNPYKGTATVVVGPAIESDTFWALLDTKKAVKPFIYQPRKKPVFVSQVDMNADDVFNRKKYKFGAEARAAGGYGFWQLAYGSTGTQP